MVHFRHIIQSAAIASMLIIAPLGLSACGASSTASNTAVQTAAAEPTPFEDVAGGRDHIASPLKEYEVTYQGKSLHCIGVNHGEDYYPSVSLSCDYMRFYGENPHLIKQQ